VVQLTLINQAVVDEDWKYHKGNTHSTQIGRYVSFFRLKPVSRLNSPTATRKLISSIGYEESADQYTQLYIKHRV